MSQSLRIGTIDEHFNDERPELVLDWRRADGAGGHRRPDAYPVWLKSQPILGNLAGSAVIFGTALGLIMREHVDLERLAQACIG